MEKQDKNLKREREKAYEREREIRAVLKRGEKRGHCGPTRPEVVSSGSPVGLTC